MGRGRIHYLTRSEVWLEYCHTIRCIVVEAVHKLRSTECLRQRPPSLRLLNKIPIPVFEEGLGIFFILLMLA